MRTVAVCGLVLAACGRLDFQLLPAGGDASAMPDAASDGTAAMITVVQNGRSLVSNSATLQLTFAATRAGDLLVVASGGWSPSGGGPISSIMDDAGNTYVSANVKSDLTTPDYDVLEIWYAANARAGATTLVLTSSVATNREAWFLEVAGASGVDVTAMRSDAPAAQQPSSPPLAPTSVPALIVAVGDFVQTVTGVDAVSPFAGLPVQDGNDTAYYLATTPGSYAAVWDATGPGTYCASIAAFR